MSSEISTRIESRIDKATTSETGLSRTGAMAFSNVTQIMEFSKVMAIANVAVPKHLRENPGACLAVAIQASEWEMSPFAVANKCYVVNDRLAYEAQLVAAVILRRAPIKGRIRYSYSGEGNTRRCKVEATLSEGGVCDYESPEFGKIPVKNSPLWKSDPDQQLGYYAVRNMSRRHFPDVLMGVYTPEEMAQEIERDVTPRNEPDRPKLFKREEPAIMPEPEPTPDPDLVGETASEIPPPGPKTIVPTRTSTPDPTPTDAPAGRPLLAELNRIMDEDTKAFSSVKQYLRDQDLDKKSYQEPANLPDVVIRKVLENWGRVEI